ncbi:adenine DNA glycosylase isoform X1 [Strongylocentrotus purpuratus]|uniref:Adenine DNA glycosylase n=1 Tax=Strongylocentrotus purpuratus TaxID=7668 RepID=A0A7M7T487_STRPU|nr:adenine DNA glycosylase isoform X1 [Strongylocentrotus purpuratus]|eukprot:XP_791369.3 PREDICTED: A/G-specific adenine DNA glycosylase [Strongylocentrotus purpuratus]
MMKKASKNNNNIDTQIRGAIHSFSQTEIESLRRKLLQWYDVNKRDLPWRNIKGEDTNHKAYAVWVSEIMCQQTQVATVIDYYNKWMKKWPTLESLSKASLEEVREVWAGLGYYSRGQRLFEGACKVQNELDGQIPGTAEQLRKELPGVGRYTAGAIASISFSEATGVVDGNVIRVLSRLRMIGADFTTQNVMTAIWDLANAIVDPDRPGDFNQSMMELGATVCHPKSPQCPSCPVQSHCRAIQQMDQLTRDLATKLTKSNGQSLPEEKDIVDIECAADGCSLCMDGPVDANLGVMNYPRKPKKKPLKQQVIAVCIVERETNDEEEYLIVQRPDTGLLAGMWEFPSIEIAEETSRQKSRNKMDSYLKDTLNMTLKNVKDRKHIIQFVHMFSHIHQTYELETMKVEEEEEEDVSDKSQESEDIPHHQWVSRSAFEGQAVSAGMRKAFDAYNGKTIKKKSGKKSKKSEIEDENAPKQRKLDSYFTKKEEKTSRYFKKEKEDS